MANDKNKAMVDYLLQCTYIKNNPLFFNFGNAKDGTSQLIISSNDVAQDNAFVDGSVLRRYTCNLLVYKSISYNPIVTANVTTTVNPYPNENIEELVDVQEILDWVTAQNRAQQFPDFGVDCKVDSIEALTTNPTMSGVNSSITPALATYNISIRVTYLDMTDTIWNK